MSNRRTKRRYAHELYPHPDEYETRPLSVDVPYLYARAVGNQTHGTGWHELLSTSATRESFREACGRTMELISAAHIAFTADALLQGLAGDDAWTWVGQRIAGGDQIGEWVYERAVHYGVPVERIKPYPCGPEPAYHDHMASTGDVMGSGIVTRIDCAESECETCTEDGTT
jgi:hypothetical protein